MTLNIELLEKVKEAIRKEPERMHMDRWYVPKEHPFWPTIIEGLGMSEEESHCGATMCIAGWVCHLGGANVKNLSIKAGVEQTAKDLLGGTPNLDLLFRSHYWPKEFNLAYINASYEKDYVKKAEIACSAIDRYVEDPVKFDTFKGDPNSACTSDSILALRGIRPLSWTGGAVQ